MVKEPISDDLVLTRRQLERVRRENARVRTMNSKILHVDEKHEDFLQTLQTIVKQESSFKSRFEKEKRKAPTTAHKETACFAVSDLHLAERVEPLETNGINSYNVMIAANRLWQHAESIGDLLAIHSKAFNIEKLVSFLLGDMISGTIHPEQILTNELSDPASVVLAARLLAIFYRKVASYGIPVEIQAVHGNHPRLSAKMPTKKQAHTNLDWLIYEMLQSDLERDGIKLNITKGQIGLCRIYKHNYVFEHGMSVSSGAEEAFEDKIRAIFDDPAYREATGYTGASFDQLVIGNMHKPKFLERTIVNGCYVGQNELGQSWRLKPIRPKQLMWGCSPKRVRTWEYMVDTDTCSSKVENPISEYAAWFLKNK